MAINNFDGNTFVAYLDISGFKVLMKEDTEKAWRALDRFYQHGYDVLNENRQVEGLFISDCGVLFVRDCQNEVVSISSLLGAIREINERLLNRRERVNNFMLTTSIAYGHFRYQERIEFEGIDKTPIYGGAYVAAFLDNENGKPTIQPGQCRIVKKNLPREIEEILESCDQNNRVLQLMRRRGHDNNHYYFYWNVENPFEIEEFENHYTNSYNLKYEGMLKALMRIRNEP